MKTLLKLPLHAKILIGFAAGILIGSLLGEKALILEPLGVIFIRLIIMLIVPLVFSSLVVGTANLRDIRKLKRIGIKTLIFYLITTVIAIAIGLACVNLAKPGHYVSPETKSRFAAEVAPTKDSTENKLKTPSLKDILIDIVPQNPAKAILDVNMLQIIFLALILGIAAAQLPDKSIKPFTHFLQSLYEIISKVLDIAMKFAPIGVTALIAALIGKFGYRLLFTLLAYILTVAVGLLIHTFIVLPLCVRLLAKIRLGEFLKKMTPIMLLSFSTSSSNVALPLTMETTEKEFKVPKYITSFVLPLGATINQNGTALYQAVAAVFIAQIYGIPLSLTLQLTIVVTATLSSIGTAGVPSAGTVTLTIILSAIHVPLEGLALILAVDRLPDMMRTVSNVLGDVAGALFVAKSEKEI